MNHYNQFFIAVACLVLSFNCVSNPNIDNGPDLTAEVQSFLVRYAEDLRTPNRERIIQRYHSNGAYFLFNGSKSFVTFDAIEDRYLGGWQPPSKFEWCDISVETISNDAAVVVAVFNWSTVEGTQQFSYTALLLRQNGELRIRLEDEASKSATTPAEACEPKARG